MDRSIFWWTATHTCGKTIHIPAAPHMTAQQAYDELPPSLLRLYGALVEITPRDWN